MRKQLVAVLMAAGLILIAGPALAKGPASATVTGPGIEEPIELFDHRDHDPAMQDEIVALIEQTGLWYATPSLPRIEPPAHLGKALMIQWGEGKSVIRQEIYLHAEGGPVVHTLEGQPTLRAWGDEITGWFRAPDELVDTLSAFGVPTEPEMNLGISSPLLLLAGLALLILIAARLVNSRLRPVVSSQ